MSFDFCHLMELSESTEKDEQKSSKCEHAFTLLEFVSTLVN